MSVAEDQPPSSLVVPPNDSADVPSVSLWAAKSHEEELCCRLCFGEAEESRPLFHPCKCSGTIKFVHQDCLQTWLKVTKQERPKCELCGGHFRFRNIYSLSGGGDKPPSLSIIEFVEGLYSMTSLSASILIKTSFVIILWLVIVPSCTYWLLKLSDSIVFGENILKMFLWENLPPRSIIYLGYWWEGVYYSIGFAFFLALITQGSITIQSVS